MQTFQIFGLLLPCMALYFSSVNAECGTARGTAINLCAKAFVALNGEAKNSTTCRADLLKEEGCSGYSVLKVCLGEDGRTGECMNKTTMELKDEELPCTFEEVQDACGASFITCSFFTLGIAAILAIFK